MSKAADVLHLMEAAKTGKLTAYNSRSDMYGNRYWAFEFEDFMTDKTVVGKINSGAGEDSISGAVRHLKDSTTVLYSREELPIREFNHRFKNAPRAGFKSEDVAAFITKNRGE